MTVFAEAQTLQRGVSNVAFHEGSQVWVPVEAPSGRVTVAKPKAAHQWRRGVVQAVAKQPNGEPLLAVRTEDGQELGGVPAGDCCLQNERDDTVDDLVKSDHLHEPGILHTLRVRYGLDAIYTYSGNILIAANPHKRLRQLYGPRMMGQYRGVPLGELSPHVYAIAEQAYAAMMMDEQRQAILISGESGAGKTESAKMVMQYLAHRAMPAHAQHSHLHTGSSGVSRTTSNGQAAAGGGGVHSGASNGVESAPIEEQVLESNPLLEAFGNAKTSRNDNSSRFGKFVEIDFDASGRVSGASIATYLLERSRVVSIKAPERSYHIFYQLCAGASEEQREEMGLGGGASSFRYLNTSDVYTLTDVDDAQEFRHTLEAMRIVGLQQHHVEAVLRTVAGVLHLGNVEFSNNSSDEAGVEEGASMEALEAAARLLGVSDLGLEAALTTRAIDARGERIVKRLDKAAAAESRDALAKTLYARLFDWLVAAINKKIGSLGSGGAVGRDSRRIGILDIYGFESFDINSFEQLCINLANERLQQQFNAHVFKGEQEEYAREGIAWSYIDFVDNQDCLDLLEGGTGNLGVFPLIDEACRLPRATYQDLAHTLRTRLAGAPRFSAPRRSQHAFGVEHYAGEVVYTTEQLMDKNKDFVVAEHAHLLGSSELTMIRELFAADAAAAAAGGAAADSIRTSASSELPSPKKQDAVGKSGARKSAFMLSSVGARFRKQLGGLMGTLAQCQPHYIRCVKPNPDNRPSSLVPEYVLEQLRAGGVLEAVRIACAGFPTRKPFMPFAQRYALLLPDAPANSRQLRPAGTAIDRSSSSGSAAAGGLPLTSSGFIDWFALSETQVAELSRRILFASQLEGWQLGRSRVFLRAGQLAQLEGARGQRLTVAAIRIQAAWRGMDARHQLRRARAAAVAIQSAWRGHVARRAVQAAREERAATRLQAVWRMHRQRSAFLLQRRTRAATTVQSYVRMRQQRRRFLRDTDLGKKQAARAAAEAERAAAALVIQSAVRRRVAQKQAARLRREAAKLRDLQQQRDLLLGAKEDLEQQLAAATQRAERAEGEVATLKAQVASLSSELEASQLQLRTVKTAAADAVSAATVSAATAAQAAVALELEVAHRKAQAALQSEIEVLRQQHAAADAAQQQLEQEVRDLQQQVKSKREHLEGVIADTQKKDVENAKLWEQAKAAVDEHVRELAAKDAALASLQAEAAASQATMARELEGQRQAMAAEVAALQAALAAQQAAAAAAQDERQAVAATAQEERQTAEVVSREREAHLQARVVALSSRTERLEADLRAAASREQALQEEVQAAKRAATALQRTPSKLSGAASPATRTLSEQFDAAALSAEPPTVGLTAKRATAVEVLCAAAVEHRLQMVTVPLGPAGVALRIPLASWLLCESLICWASSWHQSEIDAAADTLQRAIVDVASGSGLHSQAYWLACSLAAGGLLKYRTIGRPEGSHLLRLGTSLIQCSSVLEALGDSISDMLPVNVAVLLSEDAKRSARRRGSHAALLGVESPARDGSPWKALVGGISNVLIVLRSQGVPPPTVRAVAWSCLRFIDAELLNALLLRRDCCSVSAAKALQAGLAELRSWVSYEGGEWCCSAEEAEVAVERITQAARYLVQGKDDCVRKAYRGVDITADLIRSYPALSLQQVYKLTEHQHDDWIVAGSSRESMALLETLQRLMAAAAQSGDEAAASFAEDDLLAEPREAFVLGPRALTDGARNFVSPPAPLCVTVGGATPQRSIAPQPPISTPATPNIAASPLRHGALSAAPRLPNGGLPASAAASPGSTGPGGAAGPATTLSQGALLDSIGQACLAAGLPKELEGHPEFEFLAPKD